MPIPPHFTHSIHQSPHQTRVRALGPKTSGSGSRESESSCGRGVDPPQKCTLCLRGQWNSGCGQSEGWKIGDAREGSRWDLDKNEVIAQPHSYRARRRRRRPLAQPAVMDSESRVEHPACSYYIVMGFGA